MRCDFCDELKDGINNPFYGIYKNNPKSRIIYETGNFVVLPTLGQIVEGYLLIVTKKHFPSMGHLPSVLIKELAELKENIRYVLTKTYGKPIFFEHGIINNNSGGCGIDHAHMHIVPSFKKIDLLHRIDHRMKNRKISRLHELKKNIALGIPYLFYEYQNGAKYVFDIDRIPSQYFRRLLAIELGCKNKWDWRNYKREEKLILTIEKLKKAKI